ncbi:MAG TPA: hypothetical protein VHE37_09305 [Nevskiaceae bacterium]|nr:hypothetical protein [Nevskiaceae bacterium]
MDGPALIAGLETGSLPPAQFSHENHVRAARQLLLAEPLPQAAHRFAELLRNYVGGIGAQDKFHLTLTLAFMHLIHQRMRAGDSWDGFRARHPELFRDAAALIARHYSRERIAAGRSVFIEPDGLPLP